MNSAVPAIEPEDYRQQVAMKWILLTVLGIAVFLNSVYGVFVLDDQRLVLDNPDIGSLAMSGQAWLSPHRTALWTLAVNHAVSPDKPLAYHLVNVILHALSGLVLFGLTCRTLLRQSDRTRLQELAPWIAFVIALLWMIHPLQTQSVTYISSRSELVAGLCFLLTLYGTLRGAERPEEPAAGAWYGLAIMACALGMGEAPYTALAPLLVLLYDRVYLAGSFREALRQRQLLYAGLAACWVLLALPLLGGAGVPTRDPQTYVSNQPSALLYYLHRIVWPRNLCFDYSDWPKPAGGGLRPLAEGTVLGPGLIVLGLLAAAVFTLVRWPRIGFPAVWFFLTLLPASVVPQPELVSESRMYLPLAGVSALVVLGGVALTRLLAGRVAIPEAVGLLVAVPVLAILGYLTFQRNTDYESAVGLWKDTVAKRPENTRAMFNLAGALFQAGEYEEAAYQYDRVFDAPGVSKEMQAAAQRNRAFPLGLSGEVGLAVGLIESAWQPEAEVPGALNTLGLLLLNKNDNAGAERCFREAVRLEPEKAAYHFNLAVALKQEGKNEESEAEKQAGLKIDPSFLKPKP